jgi:hypothetical protein
MQDHALPPVALGTLVSGVRKGLENCQEDLCPLPQRLSLPAPVALEILELAECLQRSVEFHWSDPDLDLLRDSVATITSYLFVDRGECGACAERGDIVVVENFITLQPRHEKEKNALGTGRRSVRQIPCSVVPRIAALLRAFFAGQHSMEGRHGKRRRRWSLGPSEDKALWSADTLSGWHLDACKAVTCPTPRRFQLDVA